MRQQISDERETYSPLGAISIPFNSGVKEYHRIPFPVRGEVGNKLRPNPMPILPYCKRQRGGLGAEKKLLLPQRCN
jgi:hypothetical protein